MKEGAKPHVECGEGSYRVRWLRWVRMPVGGWAVDWFSWLIGGFLAVWWLGLSS
jgi:hypothetical protein